MKNLFSVRNNLLGTGACLAFLACIFSSCGNTRQLTYMQGKFDTAQLSQIKISEPVIRKGDLLSIVVYSDNPAATAIYNQSVVTVSSGNAAGNSGNTNTGGGTG